MEYFNAPIAISEQVFTPEEARIAGLVDMVENDLLVHGMDARYAGSREGECGFVSDAVKAFAEMDGLPADTFATEELHEAYAGIDMDDQAFSHFFAVVQSGNQPFLVDLSFGQFFTPGGNVSQYRSVIDTMVYSGQSTQHPLAQALLTKGYAPLHDETLRQYMALTSSAGPRSRDYIASGSMANFGQLEPEAVAYTTDEFKTGLAYHAGTRQYCAATACSRLLSIAA